MALVGEFRERLSASLTVKGIRVSRWRGGTRISNHLLSVSAVPQPTVLYVKECNNTSGFWGLTKNQIDCLEKNSSRWFVVLLHCAPDAGYVLQGDAVLGLINEGSITLSKDGDYKLHENDLAAMCRFKGIENLKSQVL